jgi:hypothetical protein
MFAHVSAARIQSNTYQAHHWTHLQVPRKYARWVMTRAQNPGLLCAQLGNRGFWDQAWKRVCQLLYSSTASLNNFRFSLQALLPLPSLSLCPNPIGSSPSGHAPIVKKYVDSFRRVYSLNKGARATNPVATGRYPEDVHFSRNVRV